ncbi:pilus assembly protein [Desulfatitalea alkaliphila]|uniref:Type IV pilus assembly protein PilY1 n=1 Tax=Desulfatitalea alkaliphila TaxID=2929485 RepID=A0AA41R4V7_9BACT|nr:hypothetical protein [Desulfatitalea alkaliphila]MCJ8499313.1 hypothetical protein [Desulfatitalea alkaliphila]
MKTNRRTIRAGRAAGIALALLWGLLGSGMVATAAAGNDWTKPKMADYVQLPPFVAYSVKPNIMILLDNSGSMNETAYGGSYQGEPYNGPDQPAVRYYGYFNPDFFYTYDNANDLFVPTHRRGDYNTASRSWQVAEVLRSGAGSGPLDSTAIVERRLWDGNWLNWLTMRRIDILRKVLVGGRVEDSSAGSGTGVQDLVGENNAIMGVINKTSTPGADIAVSPHANDQNYRVNLDGTLEAGSARYRVRVQKNSRFEPDEFLDGELVGVLQRVGDQARWGNMWFNRRITDRWGVEDVAGGYVAHPIDNGVTPDMVLDLRTKTCDTWTPLAETFYVALHYFRGDPVTHSAYTNTFATGSNYVDPFVDTELNQLVPCAPNFVLLLTDGASTQDQAIPRSSAGNLMGYGYARQTAGNIPEHLLNYDPAPWTVENPGYANNGTDYLADLALYARYNNLREEGAFACYENNIVLYTIVAMLDEQDREYAATRELLMKAALLGGYGDSNGDGIPDTYYEAADGYQLERDLMQIFGDMVARAATGTAASVVSNPRSGQGAVYQSLFFPALSDDAGNTIKWAGQVHGLLMDRHGNLREDTNSNARLDLNRPAGGTADRFLVFNTEAPEQQDGCPPPEGERVTVSRYSGTDADGNPLNAPDLESDPVDTVEPLAIHYLWSSSDWLNAPDLQPTAQRAYDANEPKRHIFTFVNANGSMVVQNDSDIRPFVADAQHPPTWREMTTPADFWAYLHVHEPFSPPANMVENPSRFQEMVTHQARRVVNFIRGEDQDATTTPGGVPLATFRSRQHNGRTWRLADIVHSSPTVVGRPAENYDLIYRDSSYSAFYRRYRHRRNVVYVGSNGGMLHAFNAGFYNDFNRQFSTVPLDDAGEPIPPPQGAVPRQYNPLPLGAELWAYVPFNLLPHLYWLTRPDYEHIYYVDLEPRIFDARIFDARDPDYPGGWGTVLVAGMRLGGGKIGAQIVKGDSDFDPENDRALSSAYVVFDITNPEKPPRLLAELTFPELGFTTCHPGVILMEGTDDEMADGGDSPAANPQWYLIFGSGPISPGKDDINGPNTTALTEGTSSQRAVMYAVDLVKLAAGQLVMLTHGAAGGPGITTLTAAANPASRYMVRFEEPNSSVSRPIAVDWNLNYKTDTVYFGTSSGNHDDGWGGKLRRLVLNANTNPGHWQVDNTMLDLTPGAPGNTRATGQPITARPTAAIDREGNRWVFCGTGRFLTAGDKGNIDRQSFYGLKETRSDDGAFNYEPVSFSDLENVSNVVVYESGNRLDGLARSYTPVGGGDDFTFNDFRDLIQGAERSGWRFDLQDIGERNITRPALAGEILTFTTYTPSADVCSSAGLGRFYALYYTTGTAFRHSVIGTASTGDGTVVLKSRILGPGMPPPASLMVGAGHGTKALVGGEGGDFQTISQETPGKVKSGRVFWRIDEGKYECEDEPSSE